ncbi:S66 family peptidase [Bacillus benzoevorans]|uniref:Muramoyltetrapeptide carboxypeptidase LdcA involved in peptidoglycan recycling n=1 Tax=Bacillus benzoevorans TaxID=1456 RepID=A0A7X0HPH0_9BACI|nr:S66 peptidase family protein [Bacillus benzoevorans]MBB6444578.1 muramoyltetrapeptide carboxypeptidase LdcA involved in peptidoglycan recycling [Bacillus benzoevorans]
MFAQNLQPGDEIRVIAPSASMAIVKEKQLEIAENRMRQLGFRVTYGKNVHNHDEFYSTSIEDRIQDLHEAFLEPKVKAILTAIGGYNANQLLGEIDYDLIRKNPKIFCGYGDTTALNLAIYQKTGLVTYSGPHFSTFGVKHGMEYSLEMFLNAVTNDALYEIYPSSHWSDDPWYKDQDNREWIKQDGYLVLQTGEAEGRVVGGNLSTLNLLQGTEFMPSLKDTLLFIEEDSESHPQDFERKLQSLLQQSDAKEIKAILIGRFQKESNMTEQALRKIIATKRDIAHLPVIANVNYGHVHPMVTLPLGARAAVTAAADGCEIFVEHKE